MYYLEVAMNSTLLIIPAFNEAFNISKTLDSIKNLSIDIDILVVDDGSQDSTSKIVSKMDINVLSLPFNLGYGAALQAGFKYAVKNEYKYVIQFDADGQHDANDIKKILNLLQNESNQIVIGSRFFDSRIKHHTILKRIAVGIFRKLIYWLTKQNVTDPTSGLKGLSQPIFLYFSKMNHFPSDYPDADVLINVLKCGFRIVEFQASMHERVAGTSMHSGLRPLYYFVKVLFSILVISVRWTVSKEECYLDG